jgi:hypothetical protein
MAQTLLLTWNPGPGNDEQWSPDQWYREMVEPSSAGTEVDNDWSIWLNRNTVTPGDQVYLLRQGAHGRGLVAAGWVTSEVFEAANWRESDSERPAYYIYVTWRTCLPLEERITVEELEEAVPEFPWSAVFASGRRLDDSVADKVHRLWAERVGGEPTSTQQSLTGFGDPENNARVEAAAIKVVTAAYEAEGYRVEDVSIRRCGWDLTATRKREVAHVEVKGLSGDTVQFWLTANEHRQAKSDDAWVLVAVTSALSRPQMWELDRDTVAQRAVPYVYRVEVPASLMLEDEDDEEPIYTQDELAAMEPADLKALAASWGIKLGRKTPAALVTELLGCQQAYVDGGG